MKEFNYNTKPNQKQINKIHQYILLGYSLDDIQDRILFCDISDRNPILVSDVEQIYYDFLSTNKRKIIKNNNKDLETYIKESDFGDITKKKTLKTYKRFIIFNILPRISEAQNISKMLKVNVEDIKW